MTYSEFWLRYLRAHSRPTTRAMHYAGSALTLVSLAAGVFSGRRFLAAAPLIGYGFAWAAHLALEGNRPETFGHPLWSLASDFRMPSLASVGRLGPYLAQAGVQHGPA